MAERLLVDVVEGGRKGGEIGPRARQVGHRHAEGRTLAEILHVGDDLDLAARRLDEALGGEQALGLFDHGFEHAREGLGLGLVEAAVEGADQLVLDIGKQEPEGAEQAGDGRHDDARHVECLGHARRMHPAVAADGDEGQSGRIASALDGNTPHGAHHVGADQAVNAIGRLNHILVEIAGQASQCLGRPVHADRQVAPHQLGGIEIAEDEVGVGHGRLASATVVAGRSGYGAGAARADLDSPRHVGRGDGAASGPNLGDIDGRHLYGVTGALHEACSKDDAAADLAFGQDGEAAVLDDRRLGGGAAHVEDHEIADTEAPAEALATDDAGRRSRFDDVDRVCADQG